MKQISFHIKFVVFILAMNTTRGYNEYSIENISMLKQQRALETLTKQSYNEVSAHAMSHFTYRCNLAVQNCLFQTQWEHVFNKEGAVTKRSSTAIINNESLNSNLPSYHYCKAFMVGKFCVDDYLKASNDHAECVNGSAPGNSPAAFKHSIYRNECKRYYTHFFESSLHSNANRVCCLSSMRQIICFCFIFIHFRFKIFYFFVN